MYTFQVPNPTIGIVQPLLSLTVGTTIFVVKKFIMFHVVQGCNVESNVFFISFQTCEIL